MEVLGLSLFPFQKIGRYAWLIRPCITRETRASSLVVDSGPCYHPLLSKKFYIFTDGSHTQIEQHSKLFYIYFAQRKHGMKYHEVANM